MPSESSGADLLTNGWAPDDVAVSRAYSCLSDPQQRAHYDRYGREESQQRLRRSGPGPVAEGFDPDELFNMFFGGGFPSGTRCGLALT